MRELLVAGLLIAACGKGAGANAPAKDDPAERGAPDAAVEVEVEPSNIRSDEVVELLPTFGTRSGDQWRIPIEAWAFEPEEDGVIRGAALEVVAEAIEVAAGSADEARLIENLRPFVVDNERGKELRARWPGGGGELCETESNGRCSAQIVLPVSAVPDGGAIEIEIALPDDDAREFGGEVFLLADEGVSVISDIDDTIKITACHDKTELIRNTLVRPFRAAPGVAGRYQGWAKQGAAFHYLSNSPLPLLMALRDFIDEAGYPHGSIKLKPFRWKDGTFLDLLAAPEDHKAEVLEAMVDQFEKRRFVLVGDTGERDPEIYAALARKFPDRIAAIYLRDPQGGTDGLAERMKACFDGLPDGLWSVFADGSELPAKLPR